MKARVLPGCDQSLIVACGGVRFTRHEYVEVPAQEEESARVNPFLEIQPEDAPAPVEPESVSTETVDEEPAEDAPVPTELFEKKARRK